MARPGDDADGFSDKIETLVASVGKAAATIGALLTLAGIVGLVLLTSRAAGGDAKIAAQVAKNVPLVQKGLSLGLLLLLGGTAALFWGEEAMLAGHVVLALGLWLAPAYVPSLFGGKSNVGVDAGVEAMQKAGSLYGGVLLLVVLAEVFLRVRHRLVHGSRADTLKYGKGIKEEGDRKNVLLGNCWQLPYCRKFVRERCPIFYAKTTCWKELTGCMCEEVVIRGAMENRPIPKDQLAAGKMIPRNNRLTDAQKKSRCKSCVIYNEHQRHKYRVSLPVMLLGFVGAYVVLRPALVAAVSRMLGQANEGVSGITVGSVGRINTPAYFVELLVVGLVVVAASYAIRALEYALFKLKI